MASTYGSLAGRSLSTRLLMERADPALLVVKGPIMNWVNGIWDALIPRECMHEARKLAAKEVAMANKPHLKVSGGAGAHWAALARIGWGAPSCDSLRLQNGTILYFGGGSLPKNAVMADPRTIARYVDDEYEQAMMRASTIARDLADISGARGYPRTKDLEGDMSGHDERESTPPARAYGETELERSAAEIWRRGRYHHQESQVTPWLWPLAKVAARARKSGRRTAAASLRAMAEGAWWTQRMLWSQGCHDRCQCGAALGTLYHRMEACPRGQRTLALRRRESSLRRLTNWSRR